MQHVRTDIGSSGGTDTTFAAVASLNNAIELANNNRKTHAGSTTVKSNHEGDDLAGGRQLTAVDTLTYYRESASLATNMRFETSIWEYIGDAGGPNEFIVRGRYAIDLNGSTNSTTQTVSGVVTAADCIPFITGIMNNATSDDADSATAVAYLENATTLRVQKGSQTNNVRVYVTLVEFTGSNWTVLHGDSGNFSADTGTITLRDGADGTGTATDVSAWSEALIFGQFRADNNASNVDDAISDLWPVYDPGTGLQSVDWTFNANHASAQGTNRCFVHVLNNSDMSVTRFQDTSNTDTETTIDITSAGVSDTSEALIVGSSTSSGTGTAYGRGWRNYFFNSATQIAHWCHRSGNTMSHEIQVAVLPQDTPASGVDVSAKSTTLLLSVDAISFAPGAAQIDASESSLDLESASVSVSAGVVNVIVSTAASSLLLSSDASLFVAGALSVTARTSTLLLEIDRSIVEKGAYSLTAQISSLSVETSPASVTLGALSIVSGATSLQAETKQVAVLVGATTRNALSAALLLETKQAQVAAGATLISANTASLRLTTNASQVVTAATIRQARASTLLLTTSPTSLLADAITVNARSSSLLLTQQMSTLSLGAVTIEARAASLLTSSDQTAVSAGVTPSITITAGASTLMLAIESVSFVPGSSSTTALTTALLLQTNSTSTLVDDYVATTSTAALLLSVDASATIPGPLSVLSRTSSLMISSTAVDVSDGAPIFIDALTTALLLVAASTNVEQFGVTPPENIFKVSADLRDYKIRKESRDFAVDAEMRDYVVKYERREFNVVAGNRTFNVPKGGT